MRTDELLNLVDDSAKDTLSDFIDYDKIESVKIRIVEEGEEDGLVYGTYWLSANGGQVEVLVDAQAQSIGQRMHYDYASEQPYEVEVSLNELEGFEVTVKNVVEAREK